MATKKKKKKSGYSGYLVVDTNGKVVGFAETKEDASYVVDDYVNARYKELTAKFFKVVPYTFPTFDFKAK